MELTLEQQTIAFLWSFVLGAALTMVYIIIAVIRLLSPPTKLQLFVGDVLFMVFSALVNFLFATSFTEGNVRFYTIFAEIVSFIVIYLTIGRLIKKTVHTIYKCVSVIFYKITSPIVILIRKFVTIAEKGCTFMLKKVKKLKKVHRFPLHCQRKLLYNTNDKSAKR